MQPAAEVVRLVRLVRRRSSSHQQSPRRYHINKGAPATVGAETAPDPRRCRTETPPVRNVLQSTDCHCFERENPSPANRATKNMYETRAASSSRVSFLIRWTRVTNTGLRTVRARRMGASIVKSFNYLFKRGETRMIRLELATLRRVSRACCTCPRAAA